MGFDEEGSEFEFEELEDAARSLAAVGRDVKT
jgi:hypothetical protein